MARGPEWQGKSDAESTGQANHAKLENLNYVNSEEDNTGTYIGITLEQLDHRHITAKNQG